MSPKGQEEIAELATTVSSCSLHRTLPLIIVTPTSGNTLSGYSHRVNNCLPTFLNAGIAKRPSFDRQVPTFNLKS